MNELQRFTPAASFSLAVLMLAEICPCGNLVRSHVESEKVVNAWGHPALKDGWPDFRSEHDDVKLIGMVHIPAVERERPGTLAFALAPAGSSELSRVSGLWVLDLQTMSIVGGVSAEDPYLLFGASLDSRLDYDGDGIQDIACGVVAMDWKEHVSKKGNTPESDGKGRLIIFNGQSGELLKEFISPERWDRFGLALTSIRDCDGDGVTDYAVGAPGKQVRGSKSRCYIMSGAKGDIVGVVEGEYYDDSGRYPRNDQLGASVVAGSDVDKDGVEDVLIGAPQLAEGGETVGGVVVYSIGKREQILRIVGDGIGGVIGGSVLFHKEEVLVAREHREVLRYDGRTGRLNMSYAEGRLAYPVMDGFGAIISLVEDSRTGAAERLFIGANGGSPNGPSSWMSEYVADSGKLVTETNLGRRRWLCGGFVVDKQAPGLVMWIGDVEECMAESREMPGGEVLDCIDLVAIVEDHFGA